MSDFKLPPQKTVSPFAGWRGHQVGVRVKNLDEPAAHSNRTRSFRCGGVFPARRRFVVRLPRVRCDSSRLKRGPRRLGRVLDTLPKTGRFVLNGTDRPFGDHSGAKAKVAPAIRPWTLHDLRRSFASGLQRLGVAPHIVELALNHRSGTFSGVAGIYQRHRYVREVREAFESWSQHIQALTTKKAVAA